ncbi:MAG: FHA domain-containing protein [Pseudomonadota bacterium]
MGFFRNLFRKRPDTPRQDLANASSVAQDGAAAEGSRPSATDMLNAMSEQMDGTPGAAPVASIWDVADGEPDAAPAQPADGGATDAGSSKRRNKTRLIGFDTSEGESVGLFDEEPAPAPEAATAGARRNKTRLIGFDTSEGDVVGLFDDSESEGAAAQPPSASGAGAALPVGWLVVVEGPGRGIVTTLVTGANTIGRGATMAVALQQDTLSEGLYATLTHTPGAGFALASSGSGISLHINGTEPGGTAAVPIQSGTDIQVGATTLRFVALSDDTFAWAEHAHGPGQEGKEYGNVAQA